MLHFLQALATENPDENPLTPLIKQTRGTISENLRGWNYDKKPLLNPYPGHTLPMYIVAGKYCPTALDVYLKRVEKIWQPQNKYMVRGIAIHDISSNVIEQAKAGIYTSKIGERYTKSKDNPPTNHYFDLLGYLDEVKPTIMKGIFKKTIKGALSDGTIDQKFADDLQENMEKLWDYEARLAAARVDTALAMYGTRANKDTVAAKAIPIQTERRIDGSRLGLSDRLSIDSISMTGGPIIADIKTGQAKLFHDLTVTGYALVYEALTNQPVDIGVILYPGFRKSQKQPVIEHVFYPLTDDRRLKFIEERNMKLKILAGEYVPSRAKDPEDIETCEKFCDFYPVCFDTGYNEVSGALESYDTVELNLEAAPQTSTQKTTKQKPAVKKAQQSLFDF